ncbi:MAG: hypothetical protein NZ740_02065 [Kiritimatiellae bacterium]|nr:hypothetical protein [Kiritimatiellia bacterium]MDW8457876.1 hypothetical protein [Verrucomicrobiota bacterium]
MTAPSVNAAGCSNGCAHCAARSTIETAPDAPAGVRLAALAALVFIGPLVGAAFGAVRAGGGGVRQVIGALAGFAAGVVAARATLCLLTDRRRGNR